MKSPTVLRAAYHETGMKCCPSCGTQHLTFGQPIVVSHPYHVQLEISCRCGLQWLDLFSLTDSDFL